MLYQLLYGLRGDSAALNVFRYITFRTLVAGLTALVALAAPRAHRHPAADRAADRPVDPRRRARRPLEEGGTPTMGGMLILFTSPSRRCCSPTSRPYVWIALGVTLAHGLIGFFDDSAKVRKRNSRGVPGRVRLGARAR